MDTDFTLLSKKPTLSWRDLEGILFGHALKNTKRNYHQDTRFHKLKKTQDDFEEWIFSAMDSGELEAIKWGRDPINGNPGLEIKRGVLCSWLVGKDVLGWLEKRKVPVHNEAIKFIKAEAGAQPLKKTERADDSPQGTPAHSVPSPHPNSFKNDGDVWAITFQGQVLKSVKDTDGMSYIAILIAQATAGRAEPIKHESGIDSLKLYALCKVDGSVTPQTEENFLDNEGRRSGAAISHYQQEIITPAIIKQIQAEIGLLEERAEELNTASGFDGEDSQKEKDDVDDKIYDLTEFLKKSTRPDPENPGRRIPIDFAGPSRNASGRIHHALEKAYRNIKKSSNDLVTHLKTSISSEDNKFEYRPPGGDIPDWAVALK